MNVLINSVFNNRALLLLIAEYCDGTFPVNKEGQVALNLFMGYWMKDAYHAKLRLDALLPLPSPQQQSPVNKLLRAQNRRLLYRHCAELNGRVTNRPVKTGYVKHLAAADDYTQTLVQINENLQSVDLIRSEQIELLRYLFLRDRLNISYSDKAIISKNLAILGLYIANELNQITSSWLQDSRKKSLRFRQGLLMAIISSILHYGLLRGLVELCELVVIPLLWGMVWFAMGIQNAIIYWLLNPTRTTVWNIHFGCLAIYYTVIVSSFYR